MIYILNMDFTLKLIYSLRLTLWLVSGEAGQLLLLLKCFLDDSRFFKEPAEIVCLAFEAIRGGFTLLEFEI